ncbi:MAG: phage tail tip lysozyme [Acetobacter sp.]|uniref:phage tail tip lysozyme n=1 Tax=Acetobacter sp. TaxID=440 RepID=UPI003D01D0B6
MAANGTFTTRVELVDEATAKLKALNKEFRAAQAPMRAYQKELAQYNKLSGYDAAMKARKKHLDDMKKGFTSLKGHISQVTSPLMGMTKALAGVIGVGSVMGVVKLTQNFANWGQEIRNASALLGVAGDKIVQLNQMSKLTGLDQIGGLKNYQDTQAQAGSGMNAQAQFADNMLGIKPNMKFEDAQVKAITRVQQLLKNGTVNQAGGRNLLSAAGLDPALMDQDLARFKRLQKASQDNARDMAPFVKQAEDLSDKFKMAGGRAGVLTTKLEAALAPAVNSLLDSFINWSNDGKNVDSIMADIKGVADDVAQAIKNIDWKAVSDGVRSFFGEAKKLYNLLGGATGLVGIFLAIKAISFTSWAVGVVADIAMITKAFTGMRTAAVAAQAAKLGGAAIGGGTVAPVLALGAAAGVAGYAGYSLYKELKYDGSDAGIVANRQKQMSMDRRYHSSGRYSPLEQQQRKMEMMDFLVKQRGLKPEQAATIVGNVQQESGFNEKAIGDNGHAYGVLQEQRPREKAIQKQFGKRLDQMSWQEQLDANLWEMKTSEKKAGQEFYGASTLEDANKGFLDGERPKEYLDNGVRGREYVTRLNNARSTLSQYQQYSGGTPKGQVQQTTANANVSGDMTINLNVNHEGKVTSATMGSHTLPVNPKIGDVKTRTTSQPRIGGR